MHFIQTQRVDLRVTSPEPFYDRFGVEWGGGGLFSW